MFFPQKNKYCSVKNFSKPLACLLGRVISSKICWQTHPSVSCKCSHRLSPTGFLPLGWTSFPAKANTKPFIPWVDTCSYHSKQDNTCRCFLFIVMTKLLNMNSGREHLLLSPFIVRAALIYFGFPVKHVGNWKHIKHDLNLLNVEAEQKNSNVLLIYSISRSYFILLCRVVTDRIHLWHI